MKHFFINLIFVSIISLLLHSTTFGIKLFNANEPETSGYNNYAVFTDEEYHQIEQNLLAGIKSDNVGLQTSSAYFLGEMKSDKSLIHLIKLARNGNTEESRIIAGLSFRRSFDKIYKKYISDNRSFDL
jgi:hypothetical protein